MNEWLTILNRRSHKYVMRDWMDIVEMDQLEEAVGRALLYHGTDPDNAESILHSNRLQANTEHDDGNLVPNTKGPGFMRFDLGFKDAEKHGYRHDRVRGVSFTRDVHFARRWKSGNGVVFVFDREKIAQRHRLVKVAYYASSRGSSGEEAEEFLPGPLAGVDRYLVSIDMTQQTFDDLMARDEDFPEDYDKPHFTLLRHPLLKVDGHSWDSMSGMRRRPA